MPWISELTKNKVWSNSFLTIIYTGTRTFDSWFHAVNSRVLIQNQSPLGNSGGASGKTIVCRRSTLFSLGEWNPGISFIFRSKRIANSRMNLAIFLMCLPIAIFCSFECPYFSIRLPIFASIIAVLKSLSNTLRSWFFNNVMIACQGAEREPGDSVIGVYDEKTIFFEKIVNFRIEKCNHKNWKSSHLNTQKRFAFVESILADTVLQFSRS